MMLKFCSNKYKIYAMKDVYRKWDNWLAVLAYNYAYTIKEGAKKGLFLSDVTLS